MCWLIQKMQPLVLIGCIAFAIMGAGLWATPQAEDFEFFEKKIRPVLVNRCYPCHGPQTEPMGGLRLDSRAGVLEGGSRGGPAIVPGEPEKSLLIWAISYKDPQLAMPPTGRLSEEQIENFIAWIGMGAPDPRIQEPSVKIEKKGLDLDGGRKFWSFQPVRDSSYPRVQRKNWPANELDAFIMAKLKEKSLSPSPPADRQTWIRRVTFGLIGLPPTPGEIKGFLADSSPDAFEKVMERLLASPHYGERWGRHWLDVVRFAETDGHEYDTNKLDAWRYRDYVIQAFNEDLPYDQFVREHLAGDLMLPGRFNRARWQFASPVATGFYWFGEILNSPVDSIQARADQVDNQIDVVSKAFLGLTVACARCHDHKFDPISTADYYSLSGTLHSTQFSEKCLDSPARVREITALRRKIGKINNRIRRLIWLAVARRPEDYGKYLLAAAELIPSTEGESSSRVEESAASRDLDSERLQVWVRYLKEARAEPAHVFYPFVTIADRLAETGPDSFTGALASVRSKLQAVADGLIPSFFGPEGSREPVVVYDNFEKSTFERWRITGQAFGKGPQHWVATEQGLRGYSGSGLASSFGGGSDKFVGSLTSREFLTPKRFVHVRMAGSAEGEKAREKAELRFTVVASGWKALHLTPDGNDRLQWKTIELTTERSRLCYLEIVDRSRDGHIVIDKIVFSDFEEPPIEYSRPHPHVASLLENSKLISLRALAKAYQVMFLREAQASQRNEARTFSTALLPTGKQEDALSHLDAREREQLLALQQQRAAIEESIPGSAFGMVSRDADPHNVRIHLRGNYRNLGEEVPRGRLEILSAEGSPPVTRGSGRRELAEWISSPSNPLTARVMVNRVWKHHFGQGIVRSPDNFGKMGDRPTHPKLLDYLASRFVESGWSVKALHRMVLSSNTYRMSNQVDPRAAQIDPQNKLLHHMPVRRLEGEAIRDSMLAVAGTLNRELYGPSIMPHISKYQEGRGKPDSGSLDGDGRRSIYVQVRRNFLTPMFLAFDYPLPISTIGKRSVSTVPSQSLIMMNNEFVALEAGEWSRRILARESETRRCVGQMYLAAFGRAPEEWELAGIERFLDEQRASYLALGGSKSAEEVNRNVWADLGHVLFNSTEFIYVR